MIWQGRHPNAGPISIFGVFDGHSGTTSMRQCRNYVVQEVLTHSQWRTPFPNIRTVLEDAVEALEHRCLTQTRHARSFDGTTLCVILVHGMSVHVANVGDSRACLLRQPNGPVRLTNDHCVCNEGEKRRLEQSGASVKRRRLLGIHKDLTLSRALGDRDFKDFDVSIRPNRRPALIATPDIVEYDLAEWMAHQHPDYDTAEDVATNDANSNNGSVATNNESVNGGDLDGALILLATDGLWNIDFFTDDAIGDFTAAAFARTMSLPKTAMAIVEEAQHYRNSDNATLVLIRICCRHHLRQCALPPPHGDAGRMPGGATCDYWHASQMDRLSFRKRLSKCWDAMLHSIREPMRRLSDR